MYSRVPAPLTGAWISFCLCASFRALGPTVWASKPLLPPDTAPGAVGNGSTSLFSQVSAAPQGHFLGPSGLTAHHERQEKPRSNYSLVLVGHRFTGRQADYRERQGP